jgi:ribose transport system substrate-binding protein
MFVLPVALATVALTACTNEAQQPQPQQPAQSQAPSGQQTGGVSGRAVKVAFSAPGADHGWLKAITDNARTEADKLGVELMLSEGTNDSAAQVSQVETLISQKPDVLVILPNEGGPLTPIAQKAMQAGIPVVNVDREFDDPNAARVTVLGDNYGMGVSAGSYICEQAGGNQDAIVAEIAGIDSLPLTQDRSQGFEDALKDCGLDVDNRVAADFTVEGGEKAASNLLQAAPKIDYLWNHDDDQGVGVLAAIESAGRDEFTMIGGAGSANAMREIQDGDSVLKATVIYPSTQGADGVKLARLLVQDKAMSDLVEIEVPRTVQLYAPVVTADNVDQFIDTAFES